MPDEKLCEAFRQQFLVLAQSLYTSAFNSLEGEGGKNLKQVAAQFHISMDLLCRLHEALTGHPADG